MLNDCATFEGAGLSQDEASCGWARFFGGHADQDGRGGALGYRMNAWTFQAGGQREIAPGWFLGGSLAYENSEFRGDGGTATVRGDSLLAGAILRYQTGPWQVSGVLDFGYGWYDSRRSVFIGPVGGTASASPTAWHLGVHSRIAYQVPLEPIPVGHVAR
ncbi:autotransporter domain-containing protein [Siccirubricoccus sp. G192]|uniref:autotransporter outer membrane beta-barrel domain-containing protein n=1 Tax=Siccirubricoccus sp. G192 TaxID=2849651 RepID=UPI001C2BFA76|nr:autotransporter outer membrane beta-barrel domain-containing protein [Siccirubricoccus sp. G192]MBV1795705.1 autotransporter outer membrane beta-barrel domain-containing protein [Siccirubricoccus sp. G192]